MRRPRKPVPPNTVTVRPFVAATPEICQSISELLTAEIFIRTVEATGSILLTDELALVPSFDLLTRHSRMTRDPDES